MSKFLNQFSNKLIQWYLENKRHLPWRESINPYTVWLSEIILQQTRVAQGLPYYTRFVEQYQTVKELANAPEEDVLKLWQGLGYYSRARNLHASAKYITSELNGIFPNNYKDLLLLKGVGDYTASAISSICFNENAAVVDGNVYRVLSRYFNIDTPINSSGGQKEFKMLAQKLIDVNQPGNFNQAIMEFGAMQCVPQNPDCTVCIFNDSCLALKEGKISDLPVKIKSKAVKHRYFNYMVVLASEAGLANVQKKTIIQQRMGKGIWQQLYEFPLIESSSEVAIDVLKTLPQYLKFSEKYNINNVSLFNETMKIHKLSHQHLYTKFWIVEVGSSVDIPAKSQEKIIPIDEINNYAVPVLIENFVAEFFEI